MLLQSQQPGHKGADTRGVDLQRAERENRNRDQHDQAEKADRNIGRFLKSPFERRRHLRSEQDKRHCLARKRSRCALYHGRVPNRQHAEQRCQSERQRKQHRVDRERQQEAAGDHVPPADRQAQAELIPAARQPGIERGVREQPADDHQHGGKHDRHAHRKCVYDTERDQNDDRAHLLPEIDPIRIHRSFHRVSPPLKARLSDRSSR